MTTRLQAWMATRPPIIQEAARRWPLGREVVVEGQTLHIFGWTETPESQLSNDPNDLLLVLTYGDPDVDYDDAFARCIRICARHMSSQAH